MWLFEAPQIVVGLHPVPRTPSKVFLMEPEGVMERRRSTGEFKLEAGRLIKDRGVSDVQAAEDLEIRGYDT